MSPRGRFQSLDPVQRTVLKLGSLAICALLLAAACGVSLVAIVIATQAHNATQADCPTWHDISEIPLSPSTTKQGLELFADIRQSYYRLDCASVTVGGVKMGRLDPADPKLYPFLPVGDR